MLVLSIVIGLISPVSDAWADGQNNLNRKIFSPDSKPFNKSFNEWNAEWWQFMYSLPASVNPLLDDTGANCVVGQHGLVVFGWHFKDY
jgi:hypothetical protein